MSHDPNWLLTIVAKDPRYKLAAYDFLFESLEYTRGLLAKKRGTKIKHVSGPELLEGIRQLALQQFGRMAKTVLNQWGVICTSDIGDMVFNLIESGDMEKTEKDSRLDFENVYDFDKAFCRDFKIEIEEFDT